MTTVQKKQEILTSLNHLDASQSEKVLRFIRNLTPEGHTEGQYALRRHHYRRKAMREISQALKQV